MNTTKLRFSGVDNVGHITKGEQNQLNQEENNVSKDIRRDKNGN